LSDKFTFTSGISQDGKYAATFWRDEDPKAPRRIVIMQTDTGGIVKMIDLPSTSFQFTGTGVTEPIRWSRDGKELYYIDYVGGTNNLLKMRIDIGKPVQLTNFDSNGLTRTAVSFDGKLLAYKRESNSSDVVLIKDFK
jgi:hypothetical protein